MKPSYVPVFRQSGGFTRVYNSPNSAQQEFDVEASLTNTACTNKISLFIQGPDWILGKD